MVRKKVFLRVEQDLSWYERRSSWGWKKVRFWRALEIVPGGKKAWWSWDVSICGKAGGGGGERTERGVILEWRFARWF